MTFAPTLLTYGEDGPRARLRLYEQGQAFRLPVQGG
jgi:hypothetical protein